MNTDDSWPPKKLPVPFWKSDWGSIIKILLSAIAIGLAGAVTFGFVKRNQRIKPLRLANNRLAKNVTNDFSSELFEESHPGKAISLIAFVDEDPLVYGASGMSIYQSEK